MRWDSLFDDLESQLEHELHTEDLDLAAEEHRLRLGRLTLRDRLMALVDDSSGRGISVELVTGESVTVVPRTFGRDWFAADLVSPPAASRACIVPLDAITGIVIPKDRITRSIRVSDTDQSEPRLTDRIGIAFALRDLCRRRSYVSIHAAGGVRRGTIDRVARDHVDIAVHEPGTARREREVAHHRVVPLAHIALITM
ncbi:hypothetical protein GCM10027416_05470 [Okibacterium endophyticum]